jgi:hypothetical protein
MNARACAYDSAAARKGGEGNVGGWHAGRGRLAEMSRTGLGHVKFSDATDKGN